MAAVGLLEIDADRADRRRPDRHAVRQAHARCAARASPISSPASSAAMGGCAMIGQSVINVKSGGSTPAFDLGCGRVPAVPARRARSAGRPHSHAEPGRGNDHGVDRHLLVALDQGPRAAIPGNRRWSWWRRWSSSCGRTTSRRRARRRRPVRPVLRRQGQAAVHASTRNCRRTARRGPTGSPGEIFFASADRFAEAFDFKEVLDRVVIDVTAAHFWDITGVGDAGQGRAPFPPRGNAGRSHRAQRGQRGDGRALCRPRQAGCRTAVWRHTEERSTMKTHPRLHRRVRLRRTSVCDLAAWASSKARHAASNSCTSCSGGRRSPNDTISRGAIGLGVESRAAGRTDRLEEASARLEIERGRVLLEAGEERTARRRRDRREAASSARRHRRDDPRTRRGSPHRRHRQARREPRVCQRPHRLEDRAGRARQRASRYSSLLARSIALRPPCLPLTAARRRDVRWKGAQILRCSTAFPSMWSWLAPTTTSIGDCLARRSRVSKAAK